MPTLVQDIAPYVAQNDAATGAAIRCGAAAIQMVLYGQDRARFTPEAGLLLSSNGVRHEQEEIWTAIKAASQALRASSAFTAGGLEAEQICDPNSVPVCWATYPAVLAALLSEGIALSSDTLSGTPAELRLVDEAAALAAIRESLDRGVPPVILVGKTHWVVVYRCVPRGATFDIYFHDPLVPGETHWPGKFALSVAIIDAGPNAAAAGTQAVIIGATGDEGNRRADVRADVDRLLALARVQRQDRDIVGSAELTRRPGHAPLPASFADDLSSTLFQDRMSDGRSASDAVGSPFGSARQILRVRGGGRGELDYYLVHYDGGVAAVHGQTHEPLLVATARPAQPLPDVLDVSAVRAKTAALITTVRPDSIDGSAAPDIEIDDDLVWQSCDQSRSMLLPFYVVHLGWNDRPRQTWYVRVDGAIAAEALTRRHGG